MKAWASTVAALVAGVWVGGCRVKTVVPAPGVMPAAGMLRRCERIPLSMHLQLRRYTLLRAKVSNDFYPVNLLGAKQVDRLVSCLYARKSLRWKRVGYAEIPHARPYRAANTSGDGRRIIYERPDVDDDENASPRAYPHDRRTYRVAIHHTDTARTFVLDRYSSVAGLGAASYWRHDGEAVAITTSGLRGGALCRELVVLDAFGHTLLDSSDLPALAGLTYITFSPDGRRIAALRPAGESGDGSDGGMLVEIDVVQRTIRLAGTITPVAAGRCRGRFDRLVNWDGDGQCSVRP